jgi:hypothetical protein
MKNDEYVSPLSPPFPPPEWQIYAGSPMVWVTINTLLFFTQIFEEKTVQIDRAVPLALSPKTRYNFNG